MNESKYKNKFDLEDNVYTLKLKWVVDEDVYNVSAIKPEIETEKTTYRYTLSKNEKTIDRAEMNIFKSIKKAKSECAKRNGKEADIEVSKIKITSAFSNNIPKSELITKRLEEYKKTEKFNTDIIVSKNGYLVDGYSAYLVAKMLDLNTIKVLIEG